jgi:hypothetical protein
MLSGALFGIAPCARRKQTKGESSRLRIREHQIENEGEQHDETEYDYGLDVHVNKWWQVISITVANYGSASCAVCTVADRQTGKNITAIDF